MDRMADITNDCVHELFERQARINPTALAVAEGNRYLSYGELDSRSNELAHHLLSAGVGPEVVVGLCSPSSIAMVVGALAILKAGGAYLPLDPSHPAQRLSSILREAGVPVLISAACMAQSLSGDWRTVAINELGMAATDKRTRGNPDGKMRVTPKNLAYVIYTSGSTGEPKGVEVTHDNLLNLVSWHQEAFSVVSEDRASQLAGVGFDAAGWEIWPYLTAGASLHIADAATRTEPENLRNWLISQQITISFVPTAMAERIMALEWSSNAPLRCMLTGADTLHRYPPPGLPFALVNNYGPTECTVVATSGTVPPDGGPELPSIGAPIDNVEVHILDEQLRPVAPGRPASCTSAEQGSPVATSIGPDLTAQQFVPHPLTASAGRASTRPATWRSGGPTGRSSSSADSTSRSRSGAIGWSPPRSSPSGPACGDPPERPGGVRGRGRRQAAGGLRGTVAGARPTHAQLRDFLAARDCPTTCCPRVSCVGGPAAHGERKGGSGCLYRAPRTPRPFSTVRPGASAHAGGESSGGDPGVLLGMRAGRRARQLLHARRPLDAGDATNRSCARSSRWISPFARSSRLLPSPAWRRRSSSLYTPISTP